MSNPVRFKRYSLSPLTRQHKPFAAPSGVPAKKPALQSSAPVTTLRVNQWGSSFSHLWRPKNTPSSQEAHAFVSLAPSARRRLGKSPEGFQLSGRDKKDDEGVVSVESDLGSIEIDAEDFVTDLDAAQNYLSELLNDEEEALPEHGRIFLNAVYDVTTLLRQYDDAALLPSFDDELIDLEAISELVSSACARVYQVLEKLKVIDADTQAALLRLDGVMAEASENVVLVQDRLPNFSFLRALYLAPLIQKDKGEVSVLPKCVRQSVLNVSQQIQNLQIAFEHPNFPINNKAIRKAVAGVTAVLDSVNGWVGEGDFAEALSIPEIQKMLSRFVDHDVANLMPRLLAALPWYSHERIKDRMVMVNVMVAFGNALDTLSEQKILAVGSWPEMTRIYQVEVTLMRLHAGHLESDVDSTIRQRLAQIKKVHDFFIMHDMMEAYDEDDIIDDMPKKGELRELMRAVENGLLALLGLQDDLDKLDGAAQKRLEKLNEALVMDFASAAQNIYLFIQNQDADLFESVKGQFETWRQDCVPLLEVLLKNFDEKSVAHALLLSAKNVFDDEDNSLPADDFTAGDLNTDDVAILTRPWGLAEADPQSGLALTALAFALEEHLRESLAALQAAKADLRVLSNPAHEMSAKLLHQQALTIQRIFTELKNIDELQTHAGQPLDLPEDFFTEIDEAAHAVAYTLKLWAQSYETKKVRAEVRSDWLLIDRELSTLTGKIGFLKTQLSSLRLDQLRYLSPLLLKAGLSATLLSRETKTFLDECEIAILPVVGMLSGDVALLNNAKIVELITAVSDVFTRIVEFEVCLPVDDLLVAGVPQALSEFIQHELLSHLQPALVCLAAYDYAAADVDEDMVGLLNSINVSLARMQVWPKLPIAPLLKMMQMKLVVPALYRLNPSSLVFDVSDEVVAAYMNIKANSDLAYRLQRHFQELEQKQQQEMWAVSSVSDSDSLQLMRASAAILINYVELQRAFGLTISAAEIDYEKYAKQMLAEAMPLVMGGLRFINDYTIDDPNLLRSVISLINQLDEAARKIGVGLSDRTVLYHQLDNLLQACRLLRAKLMGRPFLNVGEKPARKFTPEDVH